jgi:hypothetical protein
VLTLKNAPDGMHSILESYALAAARFEEVLCRHKIFNLPWLETHGIVKDKERILRGSNFDIDVAFATLLMRY